MGVCDVCGGMGSSLTLVAHDSEEERVVAVCDDCRWEPSLVSV